MLRLARRIPLKEVLENTGRLHQAALLLMRMNLRICYSGLARRSHLHVGLGKRKLTKEVAVGNDTAPKKRLLDQVRTLISKGGKVSLENTSFPPLEGSKNRRRKYRKASKHASRLKASKL